MYALLRLCLILLSLGISFFNISTFINGKKHNWKVHTSSSITRIPKKGHHPSNINRRYSRSFPYLSFTVPFIFFFYFLLFSIACILLSLLCICIVRYSFLLIHFFFFFFKLPSTSLLLLVYHSLFGDVIIPTPVSVRVMLGFSFIYHLMKSKMMNHDLGYN